MVSTDDEEIAEIAKKYGAKVPFFRSTENSNDDATLSDLMREVLAYYDGQERIFDHVCCIYSTAPFVTPTRLKEALKKLQTNDYISVVPVQKFEFPILRSLRINKDNQLELNWPEFSGTRSQDLEEAYHDAGQFYWAKMEDCKKELKFFSSKTGFIELKSTEAQDIDNEEDWNNAELKYRLLNDLI